MTLTQELAQALRELCFAAQTTGGVAGSDTLLMEKIDKAGAALARYDAETSRGSEGEVTELAQPDMGNHISEQNQLLALSVEMRAFMEDGDPKDFVRVLGEWVNRISDAISQPYEHVRISDPQRVARLKELAKSMGDSYRDSTAPTPGTLLWHMVKMNQPAQPSAEAWRQAIDFWFTMYEAAMADERFANHAINHSGSCDWIEAKAREISKGA